MLTYHSISHAISLRANIEELPRHQQVALMYELMNRTPFLAEVMKGQTEEGAAHMKRVYEKIGEWIAEGKGA